MPLRPRPAARPEPGSPPPPAAGDAAPTTVGGIFRLVLAGDRRWLLLTAGASGFMVHQVAEALVPVLIGVVVDRAIMPRDGAALGLWLGVLAAVFLVLTMAWRIGMRSTVRAFSFAAHDLRQLTVARVLDQRGMAHRRAAGETLTIASSDTNRVAGIAWLVTGQLGALAAIGTTAVSLLLVSVPLGVAVLVATPVMLLVMHRLSVPLEARSEAEQETAARAGGLATDLVTGLRVLKGLGAEQAASDRYRRASRGSLAAALRAVRSRAAYQAVSEVLSVVFLAVVALFAGRMALAGQITVGELVAVVGLAQFVQEPMSRTGFLGVELAQKRASARRLLRLLGEPTVHSSAARPVHTGAAGATPSGGSMTVAGTFGGSALGPVTVRRGQVVGIVLPDAGDAAALVDVLGCRAPAPPGAVVVDGTDLSTLDPATGRTLVFAARHDASLFSTTVRDNLAPDGPLDPRALDASGTTEVLGHLPDGLDTHLTGRGQYLSGGQRQRLVLGRALHRPEPVLVLHDPTTAVDTVTEARIAAGLRDLPDRALLLVTTSPTLLAVCDHVVVAVSGAAGGTGLDGSSDADVELVAS
ncbi:ABC transporter transmembrane domain-containing protein [Oerskovia rustica]|uniref:ABC transporter ATP-binding protein n=1 Tax=Oerskovia rustica TaxID=2762237 RepID=A0ABR8RU05_9CELL|nr:ABC transporter ATP-binding protein [Oerskovia rustica]MBD7951253.1 ABC transporter ATP-binding protein [Oerskovia rustica]